MKLPGKILVIGFGAVSRCLFPLLRKHIPIDPRKITVMDFVCAEAQVREVRASGARFVEERIERATLGRQLAKYVGPGDLIIDLAWNIGCEDIVQWCHDHGVLYVNTSVEAWDPYAGADSKPATARTLYARHMALRRRILNIQLGLWRSGQAR
jgi:homospermidine synthase